MLRQMRWTMWVLLSLVLMITVTVASTQDNVCPAFVQTALEMTEAQCQSTGRNQACYGHVRLEAQPQAGYEGFKFDQIGDRVNLTALRSLRLSALDTQNQLWGVALMRVQANLPNSQPGQNAEFLLFGDVQIESVLPPVQSVAGFVVAEGSVNLRNGASETADIIGKISPGQAVDVRGRSSDGAWMSVNVTDGSGQTGWVSRQLVSSNDNLDTLPVIDPTSATYGPMQAFYLQTGLNGGSQLNCTEAPRDGMLIQTPEGVGKVRLWINEVRIELGSTAFIESAPGSNLSVKMLEGEAEVSAMGVSYRAPAGTQISVPLSGSQPSAPPNPPQPLETESLGDLPVETLDRPIEVANPVAPEVINDQSLDVPADDGTGEPAVNDTAANPDSGGVNVGVDAGGNGVDVNVDAGGNTVDVNVGDDGIDVNVNPGNGGGNGNGNNGNGNGNGGGNGNGNNGNGNGNGGGNGNGNNGNGNGNGGGNGNGNNGNGNGNGGGNGNGNNGNGNGNGGGNGNGRGNNDDDDD
jgi:hypothetical protein